MIHPQEDECPHNPAFAPLPEKQTAGGDDRRVGVEIEFIGLSAEAAATLVADTLGGAIREQDPHRFSIPDTAIGEIAVELDTALAHGAKTEAEATLRAAAGNIVGVVTPVEIIAPPLKIDDLYVLDTLVDALRAAGAQGTEAAPLYGFGVHFNVEATALTLAPIKSILKTFALLEDWIRKARRPDPSRRALPFVNPFPRSYVDTLAAADGPASIPALIDDYLGFNATRNRALDMLPVFAEIDEARVAQVVDGVSARPAFHYRLPDSRVGDPRWSLADEWKPWVRIEQVAARSALLETLAEQWRAYREEWTSIRPDWRETVESLLADHGLGAADIERKTA